MFLTKAFLAAIFVVSLSPAAEAKNAPVDLQELESSCDKLMRISSSATILEKSRADHFKGICERELGMLQRDEKDVARYKEKLQKAREKNQQDRAKTEAGYQKRVQRAREKFANSSGKPDRRQRDLDKSLASSKEWREKAFASADRRVTEAQERLAKEGQEFAEEFENGFSIGGHSHSSAQDGHVDAGQRSQLDLLYLANRPPANSPEKLSIALLEKEIRDNPDEVAHFLLAINAINSASLKSELAKDPMIRGALAELLMRRYAYLKRFAQKIQSLRGKLDKVEAGVLSLVEASFQKSIKESKQHAQFDALLRARVDELINGQKPTESNCEAKIFDFHRDHLAQLTWDSSLIQRSLHVGRGCALARNNETLAILLSKPLDQWNAGLGDFSQVNLAINRYVVDLAAKGSGRSPIDGTRPLAYGVPLKGRTAKLSHSDNNFRDWTTGTDPMSGPMQIKSLKKSKMFGLDFVIVDGKGMKVKKPIMTNCHSVRTGGYKISGGSIEPNMGTSCDFTGRYEHVSISARRTAVPAVWSGPLKKGLWVRFASVGTAEKNGSFFGVLVMQAASLKAFKKLKDWSSSQPKEHRPQF